MQAQAGAVRCPASMSRTASWQGQQQPGQHRARGESGDGKGRRKGEDDGGGDGDGEHARTGVEESSRRGVEERCTPTDESQSRPYSRRKREGAPVFPRSAPSKLPSLFWKLSIPTKSEQLLGSPTCTAAHRRTHHSQPLASSCLCYLAVSILFARPLRCLQPGAPTFASREPPSWRAAGLLS